jgi:hypothetical protein
MDVLWNEFVCIEAAGALGHRNGFKASDKS